MFLWTNFETLEVEIRTFMLFIIGSRIKKKKSEGTVYWTLLIDYLLYKCKGIQFLLILLVEPKFRKPKNKKCT